MDNLNRKRGLIVHYGTLCLVSIYITSKFKFNIYTGRDVNAYLKSNTSMHTCCHEHTLIHCKCKQLTQCYT